MDQERSAIRILNALTTFSLDNFDDRLRLQKIVYIARGMGFNPGYSFDWYRRGPYSPSLTRMLFSANEQNQLRLGRFSLTDSEKEVVSKLKEFLGEDVDNPKMLELLASVWYFMPRKSISNKEKNDLIEKIERFKPKYSRKEIIKAIKRVKRFG